jgi:hypothetical protein
MIAILSNITFDLPAHHACDLEDEDCTPSPAPGHELPQEDPEAVDIRCKVQARPFSHLRRCVDAVKAGAEEARWPQAARHTEFTKLGTDGQTSKRRRQIFILTRVILHTLATLITRELAEAMRHLAPVTSSPIKCCTFQFLTRQIMHFQGGGTLP